MYHAQRLVEEAAASDENIVGEGVSVSGPPGDLPRAQEATPKGVAAERAIAYIDLLAAGDLRKPRRRLILGWPRPCPAPNCRIRYTVLAPLVVAAALGLAGWGWWLHGAGQPERAAKELAQVSESSDAALGAPKVVVDLRHLVYMSSVGYGPFISLRVLVRDAGGGWCSADSRRC